VADKSALDYESPSEDSLLAVGKRSRRSLWTSSKLLTWLLSVFVVIGCTGFNIRLFFKTTKLSGDSPSNSNNLQPVHSYIGLEDLKSRLNETYEQSLLITNYPHILTQVSSKEPDKIWPDDTSKHFTQALGTVSPDARRFHVEPGLSSIAQFRVIDFAMEKCHLQLDLSLLRVENSNWAWPTPGLTIWRLDSPGQFVDVKTLSWNRRPPRMEKLTSWELTSEAHFQSETFDCPWGTYPAFEFECESLGCLIDFWNNPSEISGSPALTLIQESSLV